MITDPTIVKAFIVAQGNRMLRRRHALDLAPFEDALGAGLRTGAGAALCFEAERVTG